MTRIVCYCVAPSRIRTYDFAVDSSECFAFVFNSRTL